jgi:tetratricopeptide (TPR) repeat protein
MKRIIVTGVLLATGVASLIAQPPAAAGRGAATAAAPATAPAAAPAAPAGPAPKSPEELKAIQAIMAAQQANNMDAVIAAAESLLTTYADTDFKELALTLEAAAYEAKRNSDRAEVMWGRVLQISPKSLQANISTAELLLKRTNEKDLDRDEKLATAQKHLDAVLEIVKGPKVNSQMTDEQWAQAGQSYSAQVHNDLATMAVIRAGAFKDDQKKYYDQAVSEFQLAVQQDPQPAYQAKLASALLTAGKPAEAAALCDKILAAPDLHPQIKAFVDKVKAAATPKAPAAK